jgi:excisionase family DNA binding protein
MQNKKDKLWELQQNPQVMGQKEVLSLKEAANYMGLSPLTLYRKTSRKEIVHFKPGGKIIYMKFSDIQEYMLRNRIASRDEIEAEAANYMVTGKHAKKKGGE